MSKKILMSLMVGLLILTTIPSFAGSPYKSFWLEIQDEYEEPRTDFVSITVYDIDTTNAASIYNSPTGGTKTNPILLAATSDGRTSWYGDDSTYDVLVTFSTQTLLYEDLTVYNNRIMALDVAKPLTEYFDKVTVELTTAGTGFRGDVTCSLTTSSWTLPFWGTATFTTPTQVAVGSGAGGVFEVNMTSAFQGALTGVTCGAFIGAYSNATGGRKPNAGLWIETIAGTNADFAATGASSDMPIIALVTSGAGTKSSLAFEFGYEGAGKTVTTTSGGMFYQATIQMKANGTLIYMPTSTVEGTYTTAYLIQSSLATDSSSSTTGAVIIAGGVGIAKKLYLGTGLYMATDQKIDFNAGDVTITYSTAIGGLLTFADGHVRYDGAMQQQFREATQYLRSDTSGSLIVSSQTALHLAIAGTNEIDISATTMAMNANTISELSHVYFNASAAMLQDAGDNLTIYGGNTSGDHLYLYGSTANASPNIAINGNDRVLLTGNLAVTGLLNVSGIVTFDSATGVNMTDGNLTLSEAHYLQFVTADHSIRKVGGALYITATSPGEIVLTSAGTFLNGGPTTIQGTNSLYFNDSTARMASTAAGKIAVYCASTAEDAFKIGTGAGGGIKFETFLRLHVTDGEGAVEGQIWYDDSENKLKFFNGTQVETVTSST